MNFRLVSLLCILVILSSCGGAKKISTSGTKVTAVKDIVKFHEAASPDFKTLAARVQVMYEDEKKSQSITTSVRMEKDKIIWIKASILGITLAKVLITPEKVSYYESISSTYFEGDFELLSDLLGTQINFKKAQDILLGQAIFDMNASNYKVDLLQDDYKLLPKRQPQNFIYSILLNRDNFKVRSETLSQPDQNSLLTINYGDYQLIDGSYYPSEVKIDATKNEDKTRIEVKYKKIDLNVSLSFPFTIPNGYDEIQLK